MSSTSATTDDTSTGPSSGGLLGTLGGLMKMADPMFLISMGAGLMSGARYGSNAGEGLLQGLNMYQQQKQGQLQQQLTKQQLQTGQLGLQRQQMMMNAAQQALGGQGAQTPQGGLLGPQSAPQSQPQAPAGQFLPGISPMPSQGAPQQPPAAAQGLPSSLQAPSMDQIYGTTYPGGMNPQYTRAMAMFSQDPAAALLQSRNDQLKLAQQNYAPTISKLDQLIKSDSTTKYLNGQAYADIKAAWPQLAAQNGMDPDKDYNDQNVRFALTGLRNQFAAGLQEPTEAPAARWQDENGPLGSQYQTNPITGERKQIRGEEPLKDVIMNGQPVALPASQAAGKQPFNATLAVASNISNDAKEQAYQTFRQTGQMPTGGRGGAAAQAAYANYIASRAKADGIPLSGAAQAQVYKAQQGVIDDFTKGKTAQSLNGINTSVQHMDLLPPLIDALDNGNLTAVNRVSNWFKQQTGNPAPTNYAAIKEFVGGEVAKAVLPGGGGEAERQALTKPLQDANSPEQLKQAVSTIQKALAGKTESLRNQWDVGTNGTQGDFDKFLLPATKKALGINNASSSQDDQTPSPPVRVKSPQEALALKPGTVFITPDGRTKVR
jgi:hypothetical protein